MLGLDVFDIIEANSWLSIGNLAEPIEQWSLEMLSLLAARSDHELISVTLILHNLFHQSKCMKTVDLNYT